MKPAITVLLCTVRDDHCYADHLDWHTIGSVVEDLSHQTFRHFELVVVDGLYEHRRDSVSRIAARAPFPVVHVPPRRSPWVDLKSVAICAYRNTGLSWAQGELVVNLDDCCRLPPIYLEVFYLAWTRKKVCAVMTWPRQGDWRQPQRVDRPGIVYGYGSYPLRVALDLNGYDEAFDGGQALEDTDWGTRLFNAGVPQALVAIDDGSDMPLIDETTGRPRRFEFLNQTPHALEVIDPARRILKCCNAAWETERVLRQVQRANVSELWGGEWSRSLVGPCQFINPDDTCQHHLGRNKCAYLDLGFPRQRSLAAEVIAQHPPVFDLAAARKENGLDG